MFEGFVHPALAFGALLASVPLIIHLMNRQRHKPMQWAAMRFVLAAYKKTRRQVQLENLILLLLRMAAVALLAFAIARPYASRESALAVLTEERRDVVLIVDASASTGYREEVQTVYERIIERASDLVGELDAGRGDRTRLLLAGDTPRLLAWTGPEKALSMLATLESPLDVSCDLPAALAEVVRMAEEDAAGTGQSALEVRLLTDLQRSVFDPGIEISEPGDDAEENTEEASRAGLLSEQLDLLENLGLRVLVEDYGPTESTPPNLAIEAVGPAGRVASAGSPQEIRVRVRNYGSSPRAGVRVALFVDRERQPSQRIDVPAGGLAEAVFVQRFETPGPHTLEAELDGDRLAIDDRRPHVLIVPAPVRVLVVNGERKRGLAEDETGYLMAVLEPIDDAGFGGGGATPFLPTEIAPEALSDEDLELRDFDLICLANVAGWNPRVVSRLEEAVDAGTSLWITLGARVDLADFDAKLFRPDGSGLSPAELGRVVAVSNPRESYYRVESFQEDHPVLSFFSDDEWRPLLTEVPIHGFVSSEPLQNARVLATLDDAQSSPLMIERDYGRGRVILWTTTIDKDWSRIPESPRTFLPLVHGLVREFGRREDPARNLAPGDAARLLHGGDFPRGADLVRPGGTRRVLDGEPTEAPDGRWLLPAVHGEDTTVAGLYTIELDGGLEEPFAVQLDPREGNLARILPEELPGVHPALVPVSLGPGGETAGEDEGRSGEIWRWLALACLLCLVGESLWGAWIGQRRRVA